MKTKLPAKAPPKLPSFEGVTLDSLNTIDSLLEAKKLYDLAGVSEIVGLCRRYLRILCHKGKVDHLKLLGRYYMTPQQVAALLTPVKKTAP